MVGESRKPGRDNFFKKTQLPRTSPVTPDKKSSDPDLRKLRKAMPKNTYANRMDAFFSDNITTSFNEMMKAIMVGEGIDIIIDKNEEAEEIINDWNNSVNVKDQTIEEILGDVWTDNIINAKSLLRVFKDKRSEERKIDLQRVSTKNVKTETHPTFGWRAFIQVANVPRKVITRRQYYNRVAEQSYPLEKELQVRARIMIPDVPQSCLYFSFFDTPPVGTVLYDLVIKKWTKWFMRKFAEKYWAPFLIGYVGDPKSGMMPTQKEDQNDALQRTANALKRVRNFGVGAVLGHTKIDVLDVKSKKTDFYVDAIEFLNKQIMLGILGSIALREGERQKAENTDIVQQGWLRYIRGIRNIMSIKLKEFYSRTLLPVYGIEEIKPEEIKISFPSLRTVETDKIVNAVSKAAKIGIFRNANEIRKILKPVWQHIDGDLSDEELEERKKQFMELNAPSRMEGDVPQERSKTDSQKSDNKPLENSGQETD